MVNPLQVTNFTRSEEELQCFWLFCMFVAGKNSDYASRCLARFASIDRPTGDGVFGYLKGIGETGVHNALVASRVGQYTRLTKGVVQSLDLNLRTCSLEALLSVHGVGNKTARFFLLHSREGCEYAVLDTHILTWLREHGIENVPKATPTCKEAYESLESKFIGIAKYWYPHLTIPQIDLLIWSDQSGRLQD